MTMNIYDSMFELQVYDKNPHSTEILYQIISSITIGLCVIGYIFDLDQSKIASPFFRVLFLLYIIASISYFLFSKRLFGPVMKEVSTLIIKEDSISFLNNEITITKISKIIVRLRDKKFKNSRIGNNYMEIKTQNGEIHRLAIVIKDDNDVLQVEKVICFLKQKIENVYFENYLK